MDDKLRLRAVDVIASISILHEDIHKRWVESLRGARKPQRPQLVAVELSLRVLDDGRDAPEVL
jgi:hypothetical protein